ncbi:MAG: energy transducer TonB [Prevotellaceae bacterium]|jgi:protein TonB|nr:energy transducer TonB [Prevotellaceae bacterium]
MAKDIYLNSQEWSDLVFENKNKAYGAYQMRLGSSRRHIWAFLIVLIAAAVIAIVPMIYSTVRKAFIQQQGIDASVELANLQDAEEEQKQDEQLIKPEAPPPPPLKTTIQFVPPKMVDASELTEDNQLKSQETLQETKEQISLETVKGVDDINAIDKADLETHQVIAEKPKEEEIFVSVEQNAEFPGGTPELYKFVQNNLRYPAIAQENGIQGRTTVRFVVEKDGSVSDVTVMRGFDSNCDKEAVRVVKMLPKFQPGRQNGRAVRQYFTLPVTFKLQQQ